MRLAVLFLGLVVLGGCAGAGQTNVYESEFKQLSDSCRERGGILAPTGAQSGRPQNDNVCEIRNQPSSRVSN